MQSQVAEIYNIDNRLAMNQLTVHYVVISFTEHNIKIKYLHVQLSIFIKKTVTDIVLKEITFLKSHILMGQGSPLLTTLVPALLYPWHIFQKLLS